MGSLRLRFELGLDYMAITLPIRGTDFDVFFPFQIDMTIIMPFGLLEWHHTY